MEILQYEGSMKSKGGEYNGPYNRTTHRRQLLRPKNKVGGGGGVRIWKNSTIIPQILKVGGFEPEKMEVGTHGMTV